MTLHILVTTSCNSGRLMKAALGLTLGLLGASAPVLAAPAKASADDSRVIGLIGTERLDDVAVLQSDQAGFDKVRSDYDAERHQLDFKYAKARYDLLKRDLDKRLDDAAVEQEAQARGVTAQAVMAELKPDVPTEEACRAFYEANQDRIREPYEAVAPKIRKYLTEQRTEAATRSFYDALRSKHGIKSLLGPYRVAVDAVGPVRGPASAPVTIVEFGDFQCPYCKQAEASLKRVLDEYPHDVRVVFRNLPLTQIHPRANEAALAAVCADRQGKFWEMHDAMYADQGALGPEALKESATRLGLDVQRFSACLSDPTTAATLDADVKAGRDLGLTGTPYFFINGRPVDGNVPVEKFQSIIGEELQAESPHRS